MIASTVKKPLLGVTVLTFSIFLAIILFPPLYPFSETPISLDSSLWVLHASHSLLFSINLASLYSGICFSWFNCRLLVRIVFRFTDFSFSGKSDLKGRKYGVSEGLWNGGLAIGGSDVILLVRFRFCFEILLKLLYAVCIIWFFIEVAQKKLILR